MDDLKEIKRKYYKNVRKKIVNKEEKSDIIFNNIIKTDEYKNSNVIGIYKSLLNEVNTDKLINYSLINKKIVCLPKVEGNNMNFYRINYINEPLVKSSFNVFEPLSKDVNRIDKDLIDLIIIPGICFDSNFNRLGFGKGYYDKYLENTNIKKIGICFNEQITNDLPTNEYDEKMDIIITDKLLIKR